jgi:hypothetical protein
MAFHNSVRNWRHGAPTGHLASNARLCWIITGAPPPDLKRSADELKGQLDDAKAALGEAFEELREVELLDERDQPAFSQARGSFRP